MPIGPSDGAGTSAGSPWASFPSTSATGAVRSTASIGVPPTAAPIRDRPAAAELVEHLGRVEALPGGRGATTGMPNTEPAEARTTFGL